MKHTAFMMLLLACLMAAMALPAAAEEEAAAQTQPLIERIVVSYAADGTRDEQALAALTSLDPALGDKWTRIMDLWSAPVTVNEKLPDTLPDDDSL